MAYDLKMYQLSGPSWMMGERFNVNANVPAGATKEEFRQMIQTLMAERFALKIHKEQKEMPAYELVVAKGGPKLVESAPLKAGETDQPPPRPAGMPRLTMGKNRFPERPPGVPMMIMMNGKAANRGVRQTTEQLAAMVSGQLGKPVIDATGLTGKYDYTLYWAASNGPAPPPPPGAENAVPAASDDGGPSIFAALQEQLGLKLEAKKGMVDVYVVDHVEKTPTEN
jgi:uncharacterized protein (TIGR03435 family)